MGGGRAGDRKIVIRSRGDVSKTEMRQSILRYLLREYDLQKHTVQALQKHSVQEYNHKEDH
jgi:hypothetical protein